MSESTPMEALLATLPQAGRVEWLGLRVARGEPMEAVARAHASPGNGFAGDRYRGRPGGRRQVTLIQAEHLPAIAACLHRSTIDPALVRRNVVVAGLNLLALKGRAFRIGAALLEYTGLCHPCSKMETVLGPGGYNAMRGHGGITARVLEPGDVALGDGVRAE